jgi:hypothetical protein
MKILSAARSGGIHLDKRALNPMLKAYAATGQRFLSGNLPD